MSAIWNAINQLAEGTGPVCPEAAVLREAIAEVMRGDATAAEIAALLMGLRCRGEQAAHLEAVVRGMLECCTEFPVTSRPDAVFDTCGTGGDGHSTVNISTATAVLASAAGLPICKHGNRAMSSKSGSADVLEALGFKVDCSPAHSAQMFGEHHFAFLFAPTYHPAMKHAGPIRRELRVRTIFNLCGPLSNPALPTHQLVGVSQTEFVRPMAETLQLLGKRRALVVRGDKGMDEISLTQTASGLHLRDDGSLEDWRFDPRDLGVGYVDPAVLTANGPEHSAELLREVFEGRPGPISDEICVNLAAVMWLAGRFDNLPDAFIAARDLQRSGEGAKQMSKLAAFSQSAAS